MRKATKALCLAFILLWIAVLPVSADSFRIAVLSDHGAYGALLESSLKTIAHVYNPDMVSLVENRNKAINHQSYLKEKATLLEKEDFSKLDKLEEKKTEVETICPIEIVKVELPSSFVPFLENGDKDAYDYLALTNNLDAVYYVSSEAYGNSSEIKVWKDGEVFRTAWYTSSLRQSEEKALLDLLSDLYLDDTHHLYVLAADPSSAALTIDGQAVEASGGYIVLEEGTHRYRGDAYGYKGEDGEFSVRGEDSLITLTLEESTPHPLYVSTLPWDAELLVNGLPEEGRSIDSIYAPYTLTLRKDGFSTTSFQTTSDSTAVSMAMRPAWTDSVSYMEEKKSDFYRALFSTLVSFGGYCASSVLYNIESPSVWQPAVVVFTGVSLVSLVHLIQSAAEYCSTLGLGL